jgi:flavin prenyltransferase
MKRMIIGISGASGIVYGVRLLQMLQGMAVETHLVMTRAADITAGCEGPMKGNMIRKLATHTYEDTNIAAPIASGSFLVDGMIVAPCSMHTLGEIATGTPSGLLTRAADVMLKERRRLVLMVRETPLHNVHLRNMLTVSEMGGIISPPVPAFYNKPGTLDDLVTHSAGRVLDLFGLHSSDVNRWGEGHA